MKKIMAIIFSIVGVLGFSVLLFYIWGNNPLDKNDNNIVLFNIEAGTVKKEIVKNLKNEGLIRSEYAMYAYLFFNNTNIQAGNYELTKSMKPKEMLEKFSNGDVLINTEKITLIEGEKITTYAKNLSAKLNFTENDFLNTINNQEFLTKLVENEDYWFITDAILNENLYYSLEGYLFPDTYEFLENTTPEEVITTILNHTKTVLDDLKSAFLDSPYTTHELLTMASIVEKEANKEENRKTVAQVFYSRLSENWSLGSDVTAFYGARKEMGKDSETWDVLNNVNPYNTRLTDGQMNGKLPIGPICSPSLSSINATLTPDTTNYRYFVANTCTGEIFFQNTAIEFSLKTKELADMGCL